MANVAITQRCNRSCSYCFAMDKPEGGDAGAMSLATFERTLDWLQRSGIGEARLLGGEPTLHPAFEQFVDLVLARGMKLVLFTGGLIAARALRKLQALDAQQLGVLVNVIVPTDEPSAAERKQRAVFAALGRRATAGLNIDTPAVTPHFLLDLVAQYDLARTVRLGLAHPVLHGDNDFLHPRHYRTVGASVADFALRAKACGVEVEFDCGWVPCMFPDGTLEALGKTAQDVGLRCNPILDVLPDSSVISCFALSNHHVLEAQEGTTAARLRAGFNALHEGDRACTLFKECRRCEWRKVGACTGGCLSASMRRLRHHPFTIGLPGADPGPAVQAPEGVGRSEDEVRVDFVAGVGRDAGA